MRGILFLTRFTKPTTKHEKAGYLTNDYVLNTRHLISDPTPASRTICADGGMDYGMAFGTINRREDILQDTMKTTTEQ